jgi:predicted MFS family arabinose efflux permease
MPQKALRVHERMPPAINIISIATFAASLSARALDPVLPHIADDFRVSIATAASFAAVFAFTFAVIQPVLGAAADLFGKARLMIACLVLLGIANILGAISSSFPLLFATRILAGVGSGGVFPVALSLTSDLVGAEKRQVAIGRTLAGSMTGNLLGASFSGVIGDFLGWRGVLAVLGLLVITASVAVAAGFRSAALTRGPKSSLSTLWHGYRTIFRNPNALCYAAVFIEGCCVLGLFPYIASFLFDLGETSLSIAGIVIAGFAVGGLLYTMTVSRFLPPPWRQRHDDHRCHAGRSAARGDRLWSGLENPGDQPRHHGLGLLHDPRLLAGICQRTVGGSPRDCTRTPLVLLFHGTDRWSDRLRVRNPDCRQGSDAADQRCHYHRAWLCVCAVVAPEEAH